MTTVLDELSVDDHAIDRAAILRRIRDWRDRIDALHARIADWLPDGYSVRTDHSVRMEETLMRTFGVEAVDLPILEIFVGGRQTAKIVPRGLWIVGTNGRLDLFGTDRHWIIIDRAENFADPDWRIAPAEQRRALSPLDAASLRTAIGT